MTSIFGPFLAGAWQGAQMYAVSRRRRTKKGRRTHIQTNIRGPASMCVCVHLTAYLACMKVVAADADAFVVVAASAPAFVLLARSDISLQSL